MLPAGGEGLAASSIQGHGLPESPKPRLLDRVRQALRARHLSRRTEEAYVVWIRRFIVFHDKRHPAEMGAAEVAKFLTSLAVDGQVAASTQNQALSALLFLYKDVLEVDLPWLDGIVRARRPERLPVVLSRDEVRAVFQRLDGVSRLMASLLYGAGLRVLECCRLRVQDLDFTTNQIVVRGGKGDKDRITMLPGIRSQESCGPRVRPMSLPAAVETICIGICCATLQPISGHEPDNRCTQVLNSKCRKARKRVSPEIWICCRRSQHLLYYADQHIPWPNCS